MQVQRGSHELLPPAHVAGDSLSFDFLLRVKLSPDGGQPNFLGEFAQGPRDSRFVYVNSGSGAGQMGSCWNRRAKVPLGSITRAQIHSVLSRPGQVLEARIEGTARDGGPMCATVPLLGGGWKVKRAAAK